MNASLQISVSPASTHHPLQLLRTSRAVLPVAVLLMSAVLLVCCSGAGARTAGKLRAHASTPVASSQVTVTTNLLHVVPQSFMGVSMDIQEMLAFTGQPTFPQFLSLIDPQGDGPFVLRVGGTFSDTAYWNGEQREVIPWYVGPPQADVYLDNAWLESLANVAGATGSDVILNVNAAAHDPHMALDLIRAAQQVLPTGSLMAAAIGNEPNLYPSGADDITKSLASWVKNFTATRYDTLFSLYATTIKRYEPNVPLAGPELSNTVASWVTSLLQTNGQQVGMVTEHHYAYSACVAAGSANYPEIYKYFRPTNIDQDTAEMAPAIQAAHAYGVPYRLTELGDATCHGLPAVTDSFATALWGLDQMLTFVAAGVDGINVQLRANAPNSAIQSSPSGLSVEPVLYGLSAFAGMLGPGAQLNQVTGHLPSNVRVWAVHTDNAWNLALINDTTRRERVRITLPDSNPMVIKALTAPTPWSQSATFGNQTVDASGNWTGTLKETTVTPLTGYYTVTIPPNSADVGSIPIS
jgi:hypothetical protein